MRTTDSRVTRDQFAQRVTQSLRDSGEYRPIQYDSAKFTLQIEGHDGFRVNLSNTFEDYRTCPAHRGEEVLNAVAATCAIQGKRALLKQV